MTLTRSIELERSTHTKITFEQDDRRSSAASIKQMRAASAQLIESLRGVTNRLGILPLAVDVHGFPSLKARQDLAWTLLSARVQDPNAQKLVDDSLAPIFSRLVLVPHDIRETIQSLNTGDEIDLVILLDDERIVVWTDRILRFT